MWVAKFKLKDDKDIYSPICKKFKVDFYAHPYTNFVKNKRINLLVGGIISGSEENKNKFFKEIKKNNRVKSAERYHNFIFVHAQHLLSRETEAEIRIFYNPQYIRTKPVHVATDGWEYWEVACLDRKELNRLVQVSTKYYHGKLFSIKDEKLKNITSLEFAPHLTDKQSEAIKIAFKEGYYNYPRKCTLPHLAKLNKKAYSTFQENLRKAENNIIEYFTKYR